MKKKEEELDSNKQNFKSKLGKLPPPFFSEDDCDRPTCHDMMSQMKKASLVTDNPHKNNTETMQNHIECPPDSGVLGRASWTLLHTMAAWYPDQPTLEDQQQMKQFMKALAKFYPCTWCAHDFQTNLQASPIRTKNRTELCQWICEQHNIVNQKLGKSQFSCDMLHLDQRWRKNTKDPSCKQSGLPH